MTKKLLTFMMVLCLSVTSVMIPSHANDSEAIDNLEYNNLTGLSLKGEEEQKEEETGESEFAFSDAIALGTHVFDYVDRKQFEESGHVARLEPLEELNTYVFANEDGTQTMYMMAENVKFVAEDGNIREKNIKLIKIEDHYETEDNNVSVFIPDDYSEGVKISFGEDYIFMKAEGENSEAITDEKNNTVTYKNIFSEEIDVRYTPTLSGLKEDIILNSYTGINEFSFMIRTSLYAFEDETGIYFARERNSETRFDLGRIFIYDAAGNFDIGNIILEETEEGYKVTVTANKEFLEAESTVYPISVDPTITIENRDANGNYLIQDVPIYEYHPNYNFREDIEDVCGWKYDTHGIGRTAIRLVGLEQNTVFNSLSYSDITSMYLNIRSTTDAAAKSIYINKMLGEQTWNRNTVTWNNVGTYDGSGTCTGSLAYWQWSAVNITTIAQMWRAYDYDSLCLLCRFGGNESSDHVSFYSSEHSSTNVKPYLSLTYTNVIEINPAVLEITEGGAVAIQANVTLDGGGTVTWSGSNQIITVTADTMNPNRAYVSALHAGTGYATATYIDSNNNLHVQYCTVIVKIQDGIYYIENKALTGKLKADGYNSGDNVSYTTAQLQGTNELCTLWKVRYIENGKYTIRPMNSLLTGLSNSDEGNVQLTYLSQPDLYNNDVTRWTISFDGTGYILRQDGYYSRVLQMQTVTSGANVCINRNPTGSFGSRWAFIKKNGSIRGFILYDKSTGTIVNTPSLRLAVGSQKSIDSLGYKVVVYSEISNSQNYDLYENSNSFSISNMNDIVSESVGANIGIYAKCEEAGIMTNVLLMNISAIPIKEGIYFIKNRETGQYSENLNYLIRQAFYLDNDCQKWEFVWVEGIYYKIISCSDNKALTVSTSNEITTSNYIASNKQQWSLLKTSSGAYMICPRNNLSLSLSYHQTTLNPDNPLPQYEGSFFENILINSIYPDKANEWFITDRQLFFAKVNNYYDHGYHIYHEETEQESATRINGYMNEAAAFFYEKVGLKLEFDDPVYFASNIDQQKGNVTLDNIDTMSYITENADRVLNYFSDHISEEQNTVNIYWSCHKILTIIHGESFPNRCFASGNEIMMIERRNASDRTLIHELCHAFGAPDHYHEIVYDGNKPCCRNYNYCSQCGQFKRPYTCIMNNSLAYDDLCDGCYNDIITFLDLDKEYIMGNFYLLRYTTDVYNWD